MTSCVVVEPPETTCVDEAVEDNSEGFSEGGMMAEIMINIPKSAPPNTKPTLLRLVFSLNKNLKAGGQTRPTMRQHMVARNRKNNRFSIHWMEWKMG